MDSTETILQLAKDNATSLIKGGLKNSYVIVRIKPTRLNSMKLLVGFANIPVHKNTNYKLTFLSRSTALPNVHATTINNWNMVAGRLDINAWDKLSGFL